MSVSSPTNRVTKTGKIPWRTSLRVFYKRCNLPHRSDSGQDRKQSCDNCTCTSDDRFDSKEDDEDVFINPSEAETSGCTCGCACDLGELEKTLENLIPNENCLCYLANMSNRKKKKKRKPRSVFDRFASPPFVIEPKPNICMHCCNNRACCCCCSCGNKCNSCNSCNSCYPWYWNTHPTVEQ